MDSSDVRNESGELARLARSVRGLRRTSAALVGLNALLLLGALRPADEEVRARRFVVVDETGAKLAQLGQLDGVLVGLQLGERSMGQSARLAVVPAGKGHGGAAMLTISSGDLETSGVRSEVNLASTPVGTHFGLSTERGGPRKGGAEKASLSLIASQEEVAIRGKALGQDDGFKLPE